MKAESYTKLLAQMLEERDVHRDIFLGIVLQIQSETQAKYMCEWLEANPKATPRRMIQASMRISRNLNSHRKINVIGIGGAGCNIVGKLYKKHIEGINCILINSDRVHLEKRNANTKIHIGASIQRMVLDTTPSFWKYIAETSELEIRNAIKGSELNIIVCGMGGNIGTGVSPVVTKISKKLMIPTTAVVSIPYSFEGKKRMNNATVGISEVKEITQDVIVIEADKVMDLAEVNISVIDAFECLDMAMIDEIKAVAINWTEQNP